MEGLLEIANPGQLFEGSWVALQSIGVLTVLESVAYTLFLFFITSQALQAATNGSSEMLRQLMVRAVVAAALLMNVGFLQTQLVEGWRGIYQWSSANAVSLIREKGVATRAHLADAEESAWSAQTIGVINNIMTHGDTVGDVAALGAGGAFVTDMITSGTINSPLLRFGLKAATRGLRLLIIPVVAMFIVLVYGSGLIVIIGALFLPIAISLVASGTGFKAVAQAISKIIAAYATVIAIPLIFMAVMDLAIYNPITTFVDGIQATVATWDEMTKDLSVAASIGGKPMPVLLMELAIDWASGGESELEKTWKAFWVAVDSVFDALFAGLLMAVGGAIAAFVLLTQIEGYIAGFLGSVATQAERAMGAKVGATTVAQKTHQDFKQFRSERKAGSDKQQDGADATTQPPDEPPPNNRS